MNRRSELITTIQMLSAEEGARQPSAADWLCEQDRLTSLVHGDKDGRPNTAGDLEMGPPESED